MKHYSFTILLGIAFLMSINIFCQENRPVTYVDPFIGTDGTGHTYPGPSLPFGMVQVGPDTDYGQWKDCSGYHYSDSTIIGFSHTHLSGTGVGDLGDVMLQPATGKLMINEGDASIPGSGYRSRFSHQNESASPGYYRVYLDDYGIDVELTATERVGFHRYSFASADSFHVILDMAHKVISERGGTKWAYVQIQDDSTVIGYKLNHGWATERYTYFAIRFSKNISNALFFNNLERSPVNNPKQGSGDSLKLAFYFNTTDDDSLLVKVGISAVDMQGALNNLETEIPGWNFNTVRQKAKEKWNTELAKINIKADRKTMQIFYTALYHSMLAPTLYMDADGRYRGIDNQIHQSSGFVNYTTFSLWDTFRASHPLFTLLNPDRVDDMVNSMLVYYNQNPYQMLPKWPLHANETWTMIGYHAVPVIADAYLKGFKGFDSEAALQAMVITASTDREGNGLFRSMGYVPIDLEHEAASKTLEYAYDAWSLGIMAHKMGNTSIGDTFLNYSANYKNVFDPSTNFIRARLSNGKFREPFDPLYMRYGGDYTEGNAWQYSWFVPHDISGLITLMGGDKAFSAKLDSLFNFKSEIEIQPHAVNDVTGLIGQYAHGNEPSHHIGYLYNYTNEPWKTQAMVSRICSEKYDNNPNGLCGNEDCGQMSAWYIWSALGMYPVNPVGGIYQFGSPAVTEASINLNNGKSFVIKVINSGKENVYIKSIKLNGKLYKKLWLSHATIIEGGELVFEMSDTPHKTFFDKEDWAAFEKNILTR